MRLGFYARHPLHLLLTSRSQRPGFRSWLEGEPGRSVFKGAACGCCRAFKYVAFPFYAFPMKSFRCGLGLEINDSED